jgi:hypothetical protein
VSADPPEWLDAVAAGRVATGGERLRAWGVSETWRVRWDAGPATIVKRGDGDRAGELDVYERLLTPYRIAAPRLLGSWRGAGRCVLELEDLGRETLEARRTVEGTHAAARLLARLRHDASGRLGAAREFRFAADEITDQWVRATAALAVARPDLAGAIDATGRLLGPHLRRLADTVPDTILHGDFEAKNLVPTAAGPCPIDWDGGRVGAHLGDLYSLIRDAANAGLDTSGVAAAYARECADLGTPAIDLDWQLALGGVVWTLKALRWVVEEGRHVIPEASGWIDELVTRAVRVTADLARPDAGVWHGQDQGISVS